MLNEITVLFIVLSYLTGAFPSAVWIGKIFYNTDVREYGSGNAGATNMFRVLGPKAGIPVLTLDIFKGWLAVNYSIFFSDINSTSERFFEIQLVFGFAAVIGHLFPIYTGFRGGKGIATILGLLLAVHHLAALLSLLIFILILFISRYVSLSSILASFAFPLVVVVIQQMTNEVNESLFLFSIFVPILSLITHQKNIERLLRNEETKIKFGIK
ncbi:MAG: glycerol-3-phosphate 1-O-acyltransferase PlsY [Bacteroidota bacterium]|nr:glycerol-3-phosphate 1-O-acyltransferase PlsY [Bacteroidota bacterium]